MADSPLVTTAPPLPSTHSPPTYPYASSPDIIRSNQKDTYQISTLQTTLNDLLRRLYGSRFTHTFAPELETVTHLLYLSLTTLLGNSTLGEEYTDLHQIETTTKPSSQTLPPISKRAGYILLSVLLPYSLSKTLPSLRARLRFLLERNLTSHPPEKRKTLSHRLQSYTLTHLSALTSPAPLHALTLTLFYFSGRYYHLSKRLFGLRYIFSKRLSKGEEQARVGYEVLGVLLVVQMVVQGVMHVRSTVGQIREEDRAQAKQDEAPLATSDPNTGGTGTDSKTRIVLSTHTPLASNHADSARYDLANPDTMSWIQPAQQRKCTLCLEAMKDPSVTTCGHVFCWTCIREWVGEKPECPLCRQGVLGQHILPLRG